MAGLLKLVDTIKKLLGAKDATSRSELAIELTKEILSVKQADTMLRIELSDLKEKVENFENWNTEKQRYSLVKLEPGILVYRLKPEMEYVDPPHELCADCYNNNQKSFLHITSTSYGFTYWKCNICGFNEKSGGYEEHEEHEHPEYTVFNRV
jgi:hypothetical protein